MMNCYDLLAYVNKRGELDLEADQWTKGLANFMVFEASNKEKRADRARSFVTVLSSLCAKNRQFVDDFGLCRTPEIGTLPTLSFSLHFLFKLARPYISQDDRVWCPADNSIRKEKILKLPFIAPSSWKGCLRSSIRLGQEIKDDDHAMVRIFGSSRHREDSAGMRGRVIFYPTFFTTVSREVINPHDRGTKAGTIPIFFECVPAGETGIFNLLYVPHLALNGVATHSEELVEQVKDDMKVILQGIQDMMLVYGFSAKRTAGYGETEDKVSEGMVCLSRYQEANSKPAKPDLPELCKSWLDNDGKFTVYDKKARKEMLDSGKWTKSYQKHYMDAKRAWDEYQDSLLTWERTSDRIMKKTYSGERFNFGKLSELPSLVTKIWPTGDDCA